MAGDMLLAAGHMAPSRPEKVAFINTIPCADCGEPIDYLRYP